MIHCLAPCNDDGGIVDQNNDNDDAHWPGSDQYWLNKKATTLVFDFRIMI